MMVRYIDDYLHSACSSSNVQKIKKETLLKLSFSRVEEKDDIGLP
jgi:hypothetical protein